MICMASAMAWRLMAKYKSSVNKAANCTPSNRPLAQSTSPNRGSSQSSSASNERMGQGGAATTTGDGPAMRSPDGGNQSARQAYRQSESSRPQPVASNPLDAQRSSQLQDQTSQRTPAPASDAPTTLPSDSGQSKQSDTKSHASREWQKSEDTPPERPRADTRVPLLPPPPDFSKGRR